MAKGEQILNIVSQGVDWVREIFNSPSKKELSLRIEDLQNQLATISESNRIMIDNYDEIIGAIMQKLGNDYIINVDSIIFIAGNTAPVSVPSAQCGSEPKSIFGDMDDLITQSRKSYPDEMR